MDTTEGFIALVIYPSTSPAQRGQADTLLRVAEETIRGMPGFISGRVFLSEDGESVVSMLAWRDRVPDTLALTINDTVEKTRTLLRFLRRIGVVELAPSEYKTIRSKPKWRLTARINRLYRDVVHKGGHSSPRRD